MTEFKETELDERAIKMAKALSADAVENAGSGHPVPRFPGAHRLHAVPAFHQARSERSQLGGP